MINKATIARKAALQVAVSSLMHFLVDGLCISCVYLMTWPFDIPQLAGILLTYNVLAFLTQPVTGHWTDSSRQRHWLLLTAVLLLTMAVLATACVVTVRPSVTGMFGVAVLLGLGNSLFHVWGGQLTAVSTANDIRAVGTFVSTGAMGLAVGFVYYSWPMVYVFLLMLVALAVASVAMTGGTAVEQRSTAAAHEAFAHRHGWLLAGLAMVALMAFVLGRSYVGQAFSAGMPKGSTVMLAVGAVSMAGKMAGGWLARWWGVVPSMAAVVIAVAACLLLRDSGTAVLVAGLFLINCTMAVTLYLANIVLAGHEGLAFGLLAAALMPGYLLAML